jgi:DNA polymerase
MGRTFRVTAQRGKILESSLGPKVMATVHPASVLRAPDPESRRLEKKRFLADLAIAAAAAKRLR